MKSGLAKITINKCGFASVQDRGRMGFQHYGVPTSGAWDSELYESLELILDLPNCPAFEILSGEFVFHTSHQIILGVSGNCKIAVSGEQFASNSQLLIDAETLVSITPISGPCYVGIVDLKVFKELGSACSDLTSQLGLPLVRQGDSFEFGELDIDKFHGNFAKNPPLSTNTLRYIPGPHHSIPDSFVASVALQSRTGTRLTPVNSLNVIIRRDLKSVPVTMGTIQLVSPDELIVLGPDAGVTGGYEIAGAIISADICKISRLKQSQRITLTPVSHEDATKAWSESRRRLDTSIIRPRHLS